MKKQPHIAIIGAGMTGASAAQTLLQAGFSVSLFEKSRGAGGRMSSKRTAYGALDFGAQYFTARSEGFQQQVAVWQQQGCVGPWPMRTAVFDGQLCASPDQETRFIGMPTMHAPVRQLLEGVAVTTDTRIERCDFLQSFDSSMASAQWQLTTSAQALYLGFDGLLVTAPPAQARQLCGDVALPVADEVLEPCWALQLVLKTPIQHSADAVFVHQGNLRWVACQSSKPGRPESEQQIWLLHFSAKFTAQHLDIELDALRALACLELETIFGQPIACEDALAHRWLYASVADDRVAPGIYSNSAYQLVVAGDWSLGGRVENAWLAGQQAAQWFITQHQLKD